MARASTTPTCRSHNVPADEMKSEGRVPEGIPEGGACVTEEIRS